MKTHEVTQRYIIIGNADSHGKQQFRILDTKRFEFEPRIYGYYPAQECRDLNGGEVINAEIVSGLTSGKEG